MEKILIEALPSCSEVPGAPAMPETFPVVIIDK